MAGPIERRIVPSVEPSAVGPRQVEREFRQRLAEGARLLPAGSARRRPRSLLTAGYTPKHRIQLFDTIWYLTNVRQNEDIRFFVGYVVQDGPSGPSPEIYPRIFYKDVSLVWRAASHYVRSEAENWIGKGDICTTLEDGEELISSDESTTDLPLEVQTAFEDLIRRTGRVRRDEKAVGLVLRRGPNDRIQAYRDFIEPRRRAQADRRNLVNGGRKIARFTRRHDPASLRFIRGYEPDFGRGILEVGNSSSRMYGGRLQRFRILSRNREIQYLFMAGPSHVWIVPPQATTTELSSYGVRTIDVATDEDLCLPGFEYHSPNGEDGSALDQIPAGYAGELNHHDPSRADASSWLEQIPVIQQFRRRVLGRPYRAR